MLNSQNRLSWLALFAAGLSTFIPFSLLAQTGLAPTDVGTTVNGFQDDFDGTTLAPTWSPTGSSLGIYTVGGGVLHVVTASGDPNHLLYTAPGYDNTVQEVLMRIRVMNFGALADPPRAGVGVGVDSSSSQGISFLFRDVNGEGQTGRHVALLNDRLSWGPGFAFSWQNNAWYWMRVRQEPNAASQGGANDIFCKIWPADGTTAEPTSWQLVWDYTPTRTTRTGYAGITAGSLDGLAEFDVDYILIKAGGLPSIVVAPKVFVQSPAQITNQPQDLTVSENLPATFTVGISGNPWPSFQWYKNGAPLSGANNISYTVSSAQLTDNGAQFLVVAANVASNISSVVTSSVAALTVNADLAAPALAGAQSIGLAQVQVKFSERITRASATNLANYALASSTETPAISSIVLDPSQSNVVLNVSTLTEGTEYTLTVNGLTDWSVAANVIAPNTQISFVANPFGRTDIGNPSLPGGMVPVPGGFDVTGGGTNIGGTADQLQFSYVQKSGDFDLQVRLDSLTRADVWTEAGLVARESLDPGSRFAGALATPNISGAFFLARTNVGTSASASGSCPVNYPNTWLRLQRVGDQFTGYAGFDGQNWSLLGTATLAASGTLYFGLAVSSHNPGQTATASFRDLSTNAGPSTTAAPLMREPLAQSSRRTSIVISEIMYHSPAVLIGTNEAKLEFVEFFNTLGEPFDISGYRLAGDVDYTFPPNTVMAPGSFLVVARAPADLQAVCGYAGALGPWQNTNALPNGSGTVRLRHRTGAIFLEVTYSGKPPWPVAADGTGHSLVLARPSYGEGDYRAWAASDSVLGSPGRLDPVTPDPLRNVVINEILAHPEDPQPDFVELYNHGAQSIDISGCYLSDSPDTNKFIIPTNTVLPARGFVSFTQTELGFGLKAGGDTVYFRNPAKTRVLDVVRFEAQARGVSYGRSPDGAPIFRPLASQTPGTNNAAPGVRDIVINEIMYHPISHSDDDEFVELYNRGPNTVSLANWKFVDGIGFTFPTNAVIPPDGYVVVAKNAARLMLSYFNLSTNNNLFGNFSGTLSHGGERLALAMPEVELTTNNQHQAEWNTNYVVVNEVTYQDGGRWPRWADGGGSSMELIDPRSDNALPSNWADSDETGKAGWTSISVPSVADNGDVTGDQLQVLLQGAGECLIDEVQVVTATGLNLVANSTFESGMTNANWTAEGTEEKSGWEPGGGVTNSGCYHVRAVERGDNQVNRIRTPLSSTVLANSTNTIRAQVRWLKGQPTILFRVRGNWQEAVCNMSLPGNLGTPGARNSRAASNAPPAITEVSHAPVLPSDNQPAIVTARVHDADGLAAVTLNYRLDPNTSYSSVAMVDDGTGGDALAGDGLYTAAIPGQPTGSLVAFTIQATDAATPGASSLFPNDAPARECLIRWGEVQPAGNYPVYRIWMTQATLATWNGRSKLNNVPLDVTFVLGNQRVIYNARALYAGSPYIAPGYGGATVGRCAYTVTFPADDPFLGSTALVLDWPGGHGSETSAMQEQMGYWIPDKMGLPYCHRYTIRLHVNGVTDTDRHAVFEAVNQPDSEFVNAWSPDANNGDFYKIDRAFEFDDNGGRTADPQPRLDNYTTLVGGPKKLARYRWNWLKRAGSTLNVYSNIFTLVDAVNQTNTDAYTAQTEAQVDMEEWMGIMAAEHIIVNFDAYGHEIGKNMYGYKPEKGKWVLYMFDLDWLMLAAPSHNSTYAASTAPLFNSEDPNITRMYNHPPFRRAYFRAVQEAVDNAFNLQVCNAVMDAKYNSLLANGIQWCDNSALGPPTPVKTWFSDRRASLVSQLAAVAADFTVAGANYIVTNANTITLNGTAPITVQNIEVNGIIWPVTWTTVTNWTFTLTMDQVSNQVTITGFDHHGNAAAGASNQVTLVYDGQLPALPGTIIINEIMYNPTNSDAAYVELYNSSTNFTFDISGWRINGLGNYTFPGGSVITNQQYLILAKDRAAFAAAYGSAIPVFDVFEGALQGDGETLTLLKPALSSTNTDMIIDRVRYEPGRPWPSVAPGTSIQVLDAAQDNARVGNWSGGAQWRFFSYTGNPGSPLPIYQYLYIYPDSPGCDLYLDDIRLVLGTNAAVGNNLVRNGDFETGTSTNWVVRSAGSVATNTVSHSGTYGFHLIVPSGAGGNPGSSGISQVVTNGFVANTNYTISYWYLSNFRGTNLLSQMVFSLPKFKGTNNNIGAVPYTPGAPNTVATTLPEFPPLWLNEVQPRNLNTRTNRFGQFTPWVELYNPSTNQVDLTGLYLANNYVTNMLQWAFPAGSVINAGEFKVIWLDGADSSPEELHANFTIPESTGSVALVRIFNGMPQVVDYLNYSGLGAGLSYGDYPDGQPFTRQIFYNATPGAANDPQHRDVFINEWMAGNQATSTNGLAGFPDPADNDYDDWFELYNPNPYAINLDNYFLTDAATNPAQYRIPPGYSVPANGFLLVWADGETGQNSKSSQRLHVPFQLNKNGEQIGLYDPNTNLVDLVAFGPQDNNISLGRYSDGTANLVFMANPTPGAPNRLVINTAPTLLPVSGQSINLGSMLFVTNAASDAEAAAGLQLLTFHLANPPRGAGVNPATGLFAWAPSPTQAGSNYLITVWVEDNGLPRLSATNTFNVYVVPPNTAPVIPLIDDQSVTLGQTLSFTIAATDAESPPQTLTYSLEPGAPTGANIDSATRLFTWTPAADQVPSTSPITVRVQDNGNPPLSSTRTFTVYAVQANTPPVLGPFQDLTVLIGQPIHLYIIAIVTDYPPQTLTFSLDPGAPANASITSTNPNIGELYWTPTNAPSSNQITVRVTDNGAPPLSATGSFAVMVSPIRLSVAIINDGATVSISCQVVLGRHYKLESADNLDTTEPWPGVTGYEDITASGNSLAINLDISASTNHFYRLILLP